MELESKTTRIATDKTEKKNEAGFTLVEAVFAFTVMSVVSMGIASVFVYAINYNMGANSRNQALAIAQLRMERLRNARFTVAATDSTLNASTITETYTVSGNGTITNTTGNIANTTGVSGFRYQVAVSVDDNPSTAAIETVSNTNLKLITITVTPIGSGPTNAVTLTMQRSRAN
jgi:Tfp pilus assembly protein PilV